MGNIIGGIGVMCAWIVIFLMQYQIKQLNARVQNLEASQRHPD